MRKKLAFLLALALLLALPGCGSAAAGLLDGVEDAPTGDASEAALPASEFTAKLFGEVYDGGDSLVSPVSVLAALAMTEAGARGETLAQMEEAFGVDAGTLRLALSAYMSAVEGTEVKLANSIWFRDDGTFEPEQDFLAGCASFAGADVFAREFNDAARREINAWVSEHTDGMIEDILDKISAEAVMYLVNALAFEADWESEYKAHQVHDGVFHAPDGDKTAEMMYGEEHTYLSGEGFTGFMKPYKGGRYAFAALLPDGDAGLDGLAASLTGEMLASTLANAENTTVETAMPGFSSEYEAELSGALMAMGMTDAFDMEKADFTGMGRSALGNIYINRVLHKTFIDVTPLGTRAGAATAVEMNTTGAALPAEEPKSVILDRPFLYMIVDTQYNIPIFIGAMTGETLLS